MQENQPTLQDSVALQTIASVSKIKNSLDKATLDYANRLKEYGIKIAKTKNYIKVQTQKIQIYLNKLDDINQDIEYEKRLLKRLNDSFMKKAEMIEEFKLEFAQSIDTSEFEKIYSRKIQDMVILLDEIEEVEQSLLEKELSKLNTISEMEPHKNILENMEHELLSLELEKDRYESLQVHNLSHLEVQKIEKLDDNIVDVDVQEE